jgi:hypothetical protein
MALEENISENLEKNNNKSNAIMSKEEQIGFHKGSINTLMAERNELIKIINITESLINAHIKELEALGVKIQEKN